jgi:glycosyltransferase involved in cell wall biosynthesis
VRILIFHGYLLGGTGSNVYNASLAAALVRAGHEVHLLSQEPAPFDYDFVDARGRWRDGSLEIEARRDDVRCTVYRPDIGALLPVYVADRYEGVEARPFHELGDRELDHYLSANVDAVREVAGRAAPEVALANHLVMGPVILARALGGRDGVPYAVKVHGSALEYTVKPHPRFLPYAREGIAAARAVLVGSGHTARSLWAAMDDPELPARTRLGPPGVDVAAFAPRTEEEAAAGLRALARRLEEDPDAGDQTGSHAAFARDRAEAARALARLDAGGGGLGAFVGKLIAAKGIDLLLAAWPLVLQRLPDARLVVVGFGAFREAAEGLVAGLAEGDLGSAAELAARGRAAEGGPPGPLRHLRGFLESLEADPDRRDAYLAAARTLPDRVVFTGRLEHPELADLLPACDALVVPSTFPEAFGMVAAEAAACGALPISAHHSGLAEVSGTLAAALPTQARPLLSFGLGPRTVDDLAGRIVRWLQAPASLRLATRRALVATARERYSWEGVAKGVIAAAQGRLDALPPAPDADPQEAREPEALG